MLGLLTGLLLGACKGQRSVVPPLSIDLPVSYKSDSAAYYFIRHQVDTWNKFGKKIESMYLKGEKFKKKDFNALSQRELFDLVKLDLDYAQLWMAQDMYVDKMALEAELIINNSSVQGAAKIVETQAIILEYSYKLVHHFGKDLCLDQEPFPIDSLPPLLPFLPMDSLPLFPMDSLPPLSKTP